jgi:magnesium transporter
LLDLGEIADGMASPAAVGGLPMPYLLRILKRDPQVAAGPIALDASDMLTLRLYSIAPTTTASSFR